MSENQLRLRRALAIGPHFTRGVRRLGMVLERCVWRTPNRPIKSTDSPSDDDSRVAAASLASIADEPSQLQRLLAESKASEQEARRALSVLASIIKHLPVGVTVQAEDGKPLFANDMAAEISASAPELAPTGATPNSGEGAATRIGRLP